MSKLIRTYHHGVLALLIGAAVAVPLKGRAEALILQGEEAELHGTFVSSKYTGYTGAGYVDGFDLPDDSVTFTFDIDAEATFDFSIRHGGAFGDQTITVSINGEQGRDVSLGPADLWTTTAVGEVTINGGANTIELISNTGMYYIDSITLTPV